MSDDQRHGDPDVSVEILLVLSRQLPSKTRQANSETPASPRTTAATTPSDCCRSSFRGLFPSRQNWPPVVLPFILGHPGAFNGVSWVLANPLVHHLPTGGQPPRPSFAADADSLPRRAVPQPRRDLSRRAQERHVAFSCLRHGLRGARGAAVHRRHDAPPTEKRGNAVLNRFVSCSDLTSSDVPKPLTRSHSGCLRTGL